jgi:uncharacterized protein involved in exopolysaccharide biosynthesis
MDEEEDEDDKPKGPPKPPLDIKRLLLGALLRWPLIAVGVALGVAGVKPVTGILDKQKKESKAETILNFQPVGENARYVDSKTTVATLKDTLKIRENILTARERLGLEEPAEAIGKAIDAHIQKNTTLLVIETKWPTARGAAELANTIRDIFLERYQARVVLKQQREIGDLRKRLERVRAALKQNDIQLRAFTTSNKIVDIEKESRALLEEYNNYGMLLEQGQAERKTVEEQAIKLDSTIRELKAKIQSESKSMAQMENLADVNTRIERLRDTIREDKETRKNVALLELRRRERDRAKQLLEKGFISQAEYDRANSEFEVQRTLTEETEQTERWREERAKLQKQIVPGAAEGSSPSGPILQTMLVRTFDIQLQKIAVQKKVLSLIEARNRVKARLDLMPGFQQQYDSLTRNIAGREVERQEIETRIAQKSRDAESSLQDFTIVSEASAAPEGGKNPMKALIPLALPIVGGVVGLALAVLLALKKPKPPSSGITAIPLLGTLPKRGTPEYNKRVALLARQLRQLAPQRGASIALEALPALEGSVLLRLAVAVAAYLSKRGQRLAILDARPDAKPGSLLTGETPNAVGGYATRFSGVHWFRGAHDPQSLRDSYDLFLLLGPETSELAAHTIFVGLKAKSKPTLLKKASAALPEHTELSGLILLDVPEKHLLTL